MARSSSGRYRRTVGLVILVLGISAGVASVAVTAQSAGQGPAGQVAEDSYEPNDEYANATELETGNTTDLLLTRRPDGQTQDTDWYKIAVEAGDSVTVQTTNQGQTDDGISPRVHLYAPGASGVQSDSAPIGESVSVPVARTDWHNKSFENGVVYVLVEASGDTGSSLGRIGVGGVGLVAGQDGQGQPPLRVSTGAVTRSMGQALPQVRADLIYALNVSVQSGQVTTATSTAPSESTPQATETDGQSEIGTPAGTPAAAGPGFGVLSVLCAMGLGTLVTLRSRQTKK